MKGLIAANQRMHEGGMSAVVHAAAVAYGFVVELVSLIDAGIPKSVGAIRPSADSWLRNGDEWHRSRSPDDPKSD